MEYEREDRPSLMQSLKALNPGSSIVREPTMFGNRLEEVLYVKSFPIQTPEGTFFWGDGVYPAGADFQVCRVKLL